MSTYAKNISEEQVGDTVFTKKVRHIFDSGACMCFNDCDCYKRKGEFIREETSFKHILSQHWFRTLDDARQSYQAKRPKSELFETIARALKPNV
jgi:hypothetical protein